MYLTASAAPNDCRRLGTLQVTGKPLHTAWLRHPTVGVLHRELDVSPVERQLIRSRCHSSIPRRFLVRQLTFFFADVVLDGRCHEHVGILQTEVFHDKHVVCAVCPSVGGVRLPPRRRLFPCRCFLHVPRQRVPLSGTKPPSTASSAACLFAGQRM